MPLNNRHQPFCKLLPFLLAFISISCAGKNFYAESPLYQPLPPTETDDSVTVQAGRHYKHGSLYNFILGKHYRHVWAAPVRVKVMRLQEEKGGLEIEKTGGSMQTFSLTLVDDEGDSYALRSVDKDPSASLSPFLRRTMASDFLRDQTAALNPYAALVVSPLAIAIGIPQSNPSLYYLPKDAAALGEYSERAGGKLYLLEEKFNENTVQISGIEKIEDIISTKKMLKKRYAHQGHVINEIEFAKARLFDLFINDRDRHEGQWDWAVYERRDKTFYYPLPKDRDQAFYKFAHGVIPKLIGQGLNYQKFKAFDDNYSNLHALMVKSIAIDSQLLTGISKESLDSLARAMQVSLSDKVIETAVRQFPGSVFKLVGESTIQKLKGRRDLLQEVAQAYYLLLAKESMVVGTDDEEIFKINRLDDERTEVAVMRKYDGHLTYKRTFNRSETKEIKLFGLDGEDVFEVSGKVSKGIKVRLIGGEGEDSFTDTSNVRGWGKHTFVYDTGPGTLIKRGPETKVKASSRLKSITLELD